MAGETIRAEAVCLDIRPWSRTSHIVSWLTRDGVVGTVVKGAVRPKSAFLGQYDLNYTCDILYYARAKGDLHALRDCVPVEMRESLRGNYRALALAAYFRRLMLELAPVGTECHSWYELLNRALSSVEPSPAALLRFELEVLRLSGLKPDFTGFDREAEWSAFSVATGTYSEEGGRCIRVPRPVAEFLSDPNKKVENLQTPLDAARVIGVFYTFHLDCASNVRRTVLGMIS